jgi:hypothetical protein
MCDVMVTAAVAGPHYLPRCCFWYPKQFSNLKSKSVRMVHCHHFSCAGQHVAGTVCYEIKHLFGAKHIPPPIKKTTPNRHALFLKIYTWIKTRFPLRTAIMKGLANLLSPHNKVIHIISVSHPHTSINYIRCCSLAHLSAFCFFPSFPYMYYVVLISGWLTGVYTMPEATL